MQVVEGFAGDGGDQCFFSQERSYGRYRNTGDNPLLAGIDSSGQEFRKRRKKSIPLVSELVSYYSK